MNRDGRDIKNQALVSLIAMNSLIFAAGLSLGDLAVTKLTAVESATLVILAASLLVFRTFRERYLLIWMLGLLAYFLSDWTLHEVASSHSPYLVGISHAQFVLAVVVICCLRAGLLPRPQAAGAGAGFFTDRLGLCRGLRTSVARFVPSAGSF